MHDNTLNRLCNVPCCLLLGMRRDLGMYLSKKGIPELAKCFCSYIELKQRANVYEQL